MAMLSMKDSLKAICQMGWEKSKGKKKTYKEFGRMGNWLLCRVMIYEDFDYPYFLVMMILKYESNSYSKICIYDDRNRGSEGLK
jgi:hypothetical protein